MASLRNRIEAVLLAADKPAAEADICNAVRATPAEVRAALREIAASLEGRGIVLREVAGGWRLATHPECRESVERFLLPPKHHMSQASLETLSIVAYLQPVTRAEVESLRGVNVDGVMQTLEDRALIKELGRKETVGRPIIYGTTDRFLEAFGLRGIDELPPLPEGAPRRVNGEVIPFPVAPAREQAMDQIHESVEGHEGDQVPHAQSTLEHSVADELAHALEE
ncbi:MAG: SMC-Scp complex subunit ScpB [Candidatus Eremiobacteraeota bacterium]|nr:SMC-Scp complex subunit ScpB [Candidatus Eremiobacteraeota bacterium]